MIDTMHRCGKYHNSKEIINDINNMILTKFSMLSASGESDDLIKVQAFQSYFDQISQGLHNVSLVNKPEAKPKPNPSSKHAKVDHASTAG